jgi:hypothetical protein
MTRNMLTFRSLFHKNELLHFQYSHRTVRMCDIILL